MNRNNRSGGFSLIELAVVLFLILLAVGLTLPRWGDVLASSRIERAARTLVQTVTYARSLAVTSGESLYLHLDMGKRLFWIAREASVESEPGPAEDLAEVHRLPEGVRFRDVVTLERGKRSEGRITVRFFPNGMVETADIHLEDLRNRQYTLSIDPVSGRVKMQEKYVVQAALG